MGVNQSSATTATDTGAGTATASAPGAEAIAELNAVTIRRLGAVYVYVPPAAGGPAPSRSASPQEAQPTPQRGTEAGIDAALTTLRALGYRLSTLAREALIHAEQAWALVNAAARLTSGSPADEYRPFYPGFPIQVRSASEATLLVNAALHYLGDVVGVRILPDYRPSPREPLPGDDGALTELGLATAQDLERIVADLIAQATPFSVQDRADLTALRDFGPEAAPRVAVKENLAVLTVTFPDLDFSASYRTVTDVLRLAVAMAGSDVSLAEPCRFPSFSRAQRRRLLGLLDAVGQVQDSRDSAEEMARRCERWKRLARHLRPGPADAAVVRAVEEALRQRKRLGRIAVDQAMYEGYTAPVGLRSASPGLRTAGRGTRLPLPEGETIRFFLHWRDLPKAPPDAPGPAGPASTEDRDTRVDLDLSAFFVSEDFTRTEQIAYYNLRSTAAVHSGDLTSAPDGAAEFIDITLAEALRQEWRYVVMTVHSFSHHQLSEVPECWAGAMARGADPQSGEVFEASTVIQRLDLVSPTFNATPFVIDLAERRLIWWDLPVGVGEHQVANLDRSSNRVLAHLLDLLEGRRMPLAHLLGLLADDVVEDPDEAELVFGEGGILPWQTERILALLGPAEAAVERHSDVDGGVAGRQAE